MTKARPLFDPASFTRLQGGHGASKLSTSAVAPLVAAARGYETITPDGIKDFLRREGFGAPNTREGRQLKAAVGNADVMFMPWYSYADALSATVRGSLATWNSLQYRPAKPRPHPDTGKLMKYQVLTGGDSVLDLHPSTPVSWAEDAPTYVFIEGCIKGDAVITAILRDAGVSDEVLADDTVDNPRAVLHSLMDSIPVEQRAVVVSFVGVANWKSNDEWIHMNLKDRNCLVAFDADCATNVQVWNQANQLMTMLSRKQRKGSTKTVALIDLSHAGADASIGKIGMDDYLAAYGRWSDIGEDMLTDLPERPRAKNEGVVDKMWQVNASGYGVREASVTVEESGDRSVTWREVCPLGGWVRSLEIARVPTDEEIKTGIASEFAEEGDSRTEIEFCWIDESTGTKRREIVRGPTSIMDMLPRDWYRVNADIPSALRRHPKWPVRVQGDKWLEAIKAHRMAETETRVRWQAMGWVPHEDGNPVYLVGKQAIGANGMLANPESLIGVTDDVLSGSSNFGVIVPEDESHWKTQAVKDLETVMGAYVGHGPQALEETPWTDARMAATILAMAIRPAIPLPTTTVGYFVGPPRKGKSFSASQVMSFWQPRAGVWNSDHLPGAAKDTVASTEHAVAHTPIWVADDLAPSVDRRRAEAEETAMGDLVRAIHNRAGKRRMNADMSTRKVNTPRALLVVTAENEPSVQSVADRVVTLTISEGSLCPSRDATDRLNELRDIDGAPARLTYAFIRYLANQAGQLPGGWPELISDAKVRIAQCQNYASHIIAASATRGDATRHAKMAADLMVGLLFLGDFAKFLGCDTSITHPLSKMPFMPQLVAQQVALTHVAQKHATPGKRMLAALRSVLGSGGAHIQSLEDPSSPPFSGTGDAALANTRLGWSLDGKNARGNGPLIGYLTLAKDHKTQVVLFDAKMAFHVAQRQFPDLLPPGMKATMAWRSLWDEGLTLGPERGGWHRDTSGRFRASVRVTSGEQRVTGVPVGCDDLMGNIDSDEDDL